VHVTATSAAELRSAKLTTLTVAELFSTVAREVGGRGSYPDRHGKRRYFDMRQIKRIALHGSPANRISCARMEVAPARYMDRHRATSKAVASGTSDALCISHNRSHVVTEVTPPTRRIAA
jgi:hypothetical protein